MSSRSRLTVAAAVTVITGSWNRCTGSTFSVQVRASWELVGCLGQQRPQCSVLERLQGCGIIEHLRDRCVHALGLAAVFHGAAIIARAGGRGNLSAQDKVPYCRDVRN